MSSHTIFAVSDPVPEALSSRPAVPRKKSTQAAHLMGRLGPYRRRRLYEVAIGIVFGRQINLLQLFRLGG